MKCKVHRITCLYLMCNTKRGASMKR